MNRHPGLDDQSNELLKRPAFVRRTSTRRDYNVG